MKAALLRCPFFALLFFVTLGTLSPPLFASDDWQPILPGGYYVVIVGARPGVPFVFREQIQVQDLATHEGYNGQGIGSGSVPVQHRMPRPIPPMRMRSLGATAPPRPSALAGINVGRATAAETSPAALMNSRRDVRNAIRGKRFSFINSYF